MSRCGPWPETGDVREANRRQTNPIDTYLVIHGRTPVHRANEGSKIAPAGMNRRRKLGRRPGSFGTSASSVRGVIARVAVSGGGP